MPYALLGLVAALATASQAAGAPSPALEAKEAQAQQVVAEIDALDASLDRSDELADLANLKLADVRGQIAVNRRELVIARRQLVESRRMVARQLVTLYTSGSSSTLEVILGAQSLEGVLDRIDTETRVSALEAKIAREVAQFRRAVVERRGFLADEQARVRSLVEERAQQQRAIEVRLGERRQLLGSLNGEVARLLAAQQTAELRRSRAAEAEANGAQDAAAQEFDESAVGASAATPEGTTVLPPASHSGVVGIALSYLGVPYQWGGASPSGFDCSGLVMYAYQQVGVSLPHSSYAMWDEGVAVPKDQLEPGDIVFFDGLGHVGIYIGDGEFVHAPHTGAVVQVSSLDEGPYAASYDGARRIG